MRGLKCTECLVLVAMLVTTIQAAPQAALAGEPCPDLPDYYDHANALPSKLEKRFIFSALARLGSSVSGKLFGTAGAKVGAEAAEAGAKEAAEAGAKEAAKASAKATSKEAQLAALKAADDAKSLANQKAAELADLKKLVRVEESKLGGARGFAARTGLTRKRVIKEIGITVVATAALNKVFNDFSERSQNKRLEKMTKDAEEAAALASKGELTQEKATELGVLFDEKSGVLQLPPGVTIKPPTGAQNVSVEGDAAGASAQAAPPPNPALVAEQTKNATIALELASKKQLTADLAAKLGLVFDPVKETLEIPDSVDLDSLPEFPPSGTAPAAAPPAA